MYQASPYYPEKNNIRQAFVNISESYDWNYSDTVSTLIPKMNLGKDTINFDLTQKDQILKKINIKADDRIFIYNFSSDSIYTFEVDETPIIACINIYSLGSQNIEEYDYEIGFNLKQNYKTKGENLVVIGKSNPFQTSSSKPIIWEKISVHNDTIELEKENKKWFLNGTYLKDQFYTFEFEKYSLLLRDFNKLDSTNRLRYLIVWDKSAKKSIFKNIYRDSEGTSLSPIQSVGQQNLQNVEQWIGQIFKDKPSIIFGFLYYSFGCSEIQFLDRERTSVTILCDNRH